MMDTVVLDTGPSGEGITERYRELVAASAACPASCHIHRQEDETGPGDVFFVCDDPRCDVR